MSTLRSLRAASLLALLASAPAFGAAFVGSAYEGFALNTYTAGVSINTLNGGTGWNAVGDASANTAPWGTGTSLTSAGSGALGQAASLDLTTPGYLAETGGAVVVSGATATSSIGRQFGQSVDSGTFYFSFLTQKTNTELRTVNLSFFGTSERLAIGQIASNLNTRDQDGNWLANAGANSGNFVALISNSQNNTAAATTVGVAANGVYVNTATPIAYPSASVALVVGKIEFNISVDSTDDDIDNPVVTVLDRLTLYISPSGLANEASLTPYLVIDHNDFGTLTGFRIFSGATANGFNASGAIFDEIRFGTSFAAVTTGVTVTPPTPWQTWLNTHFTALEQADSAIVGPQADPDGDGRSNLLEYALGTTPDTTDLATELVARSATGVLALDYPKLRTDLTYVVETSADLVTWGTVGVTDGLTGGAAPAYMHTATVLQPEGGRVFLRLRVTQTE